MLKSVEQHNKEAKEGLEKRDRARFSTGVECPNCGTELEYPDPFSILMSNPPRKNAWCSNCEFKTTLLVK